MDSPAIELSIEELWEMYINFDEDDPPTEQHVAHNSDKASTSERSPHGPCNNIAPDRCSSTSLESTIQSIIEQLLETIKETSSSNRPLRSYPDKRHQTKDEDYAPKSDAIVPSSHLSLSVLETSTSGSRKRQRAETIDPPEQNNLSGLARKRQHFSPGTLDLHEQSQKPCPPNNRNRPIRPASSEAPSGNASPHDCPRLHETPGSEPDRTQHILRTKVHNDEASVVRNTKPGLPFVCNHCHKSYKTKKYALNHEQYRCHFNPNVIEIRRTF